MKAIADSGSGDVFCLVYPSIPSRSSLRQRAMASDNNSTPVNWAANTMRHGIVPALLPGRLKDQANQCVPWRVGHTTANYHPTPVSRHAEPRADCASGPGTQSTKLVKLYATVARKSTANTRSIGRKRFTRSRGSQLWLRPLGWGHWHQHWNAEHPNRRISQLGPSRATLSALHTPNPSPRSRKVWPLG